MNKAKVNAVQGRKRKLTAFDILNYVVFILIGLIIIFPLWKVIVDSFNAIGVYQFRLWPDEFALEGYKILLPRFTSVPMTRLISSIS